jgi:predicted phage terminase large subunit-like protein
MGLTCRGWDLAATEEVSSALTAGIKIKRCEGIFYILHGLWFKGTPGVVDRKVVLTAEADGIGCIIGLPQDPGQAGIFQKRHFYSLLAGFTVRCTPESGSKVERASAISSQAEAGNVKIVEGPYVDVLLDELELFPHGEFLDRTDALSRAYHTLVSGSNKRMSAPTGIKNVHPDGTIYGQRVDNSISRNDRLIQMTR